MRTSSFLRIAALPAFLRIAAPPAFLLLLGTGARAQVAAAASPLANPGDYSFAPPPSVALPPDPIPEPHGVVTSSVGNRGAGGSAAVESALPGMADTHVAVGVGGGEETPWRHGPTLTGRDVSAGIDTVLPGDTALSLEFDSGRESWDGAGFGRR